MATLSTSERNRGDILRIENTQGDSRIAADICRQFGANSLLMLPIYRDGTMAGVLQVLFTEKHTFGYGEMGTYRLLVGLLEDAIWYAAHPEQRRSLATSNVPHPAKRTLLYERRWQAAVATVLVFASLIATDRHSAPQKEVSALARSGINSNAPMPQTELGSIQKAKKVSRSLPRWVRIGDNEVDYVGSDVTMRFFGPRSPRRQAERVESQVEYFGEDVTVRYFTSREAPGLPELPRVNTPQAQAK